MDLGPIGAKKGAVHLGNDQLVPGEEVVKVERCVEKEEVLGLYEEDEKECMSLEDEEWCVLWLVCILSMYMFFN